MENKENYNKGLLTSIIILHICIFFLGLYLLGAIKLYIINNDNIKSDDFYFYIINSSWWVFCYFKGYLEYQKNKKD